MERIDKVESFLIYLHYNLFITNFLSTIYCLKGKKMSDPLITIERFLLSQQPEYAKGDLTTLFYDIALGAKIIATQTRRAALLDTLGYEGTTNIQGERQRKLDVYADDVIYKLNDHTGRLCAMVSEEREDWIRIPDNYSKGIIDNEYACCPTSKQSCSS